MQNKLFKQCSLLKETFTKSSLNNKYFQNRIEGDWNFTISSLDLVRDTARSLVWYIDESNKITFNAYFSVTGVLQILFVQQEAMKTLSNLFLDEQIDIWKDSLFIDVKEIRESRNELVGHPNATYSGRGKMKASSFKEGNVTVTDVLPYLNTDGFKYKYRVWGNKKSYTKEIDLFNWIDKQAKVFVKTVDNMIKNIKKLDKEFKFKFQDDGLFEFAYKVSDLKDNLGILIMFHILSTPNYEEFRKNYNDIKSKLKERYGEFEDELNLNIPGTKEVIDKLDFILGKLEVYVNEEQREEVIGQMRQNYMYIEVFLDSLYLTWEEFLHHLKLIDEDFSLDDASQ
jgi:hypothetical protein